MGYMGVSLYRSIVSGAEVLDGLERLNLSITELCSLLQTLQPPVRLEPTWVTEVGHFGLLF